jgi:Tfp pilus assembly protein PilN
MIEINLLPGQKRKAAGAGFKLGLPDFKAIFSEIKNPWLLGAIGAGVLSVGGSGALFVIQRARLAALDSRLETVKAEKRRFDVVIAQKRQSEKIRDSLLTEITIIRQIDGDRYVWPHVLDQVTKALPPYTWLTTIAQMSTAVQPGVPAPAAPASLEDSLGIASVRVNIEGRTVDIQAYTTFLRQLAASPWLTDVTPATSSTVIEADRPVTAFNVMVRFKIADSVYIRVVPLVQSVR